MDSISVTLLDSLDDIPVDIAVSDEMVFVVYGRSGDFRLGVISQDGGALVDVGLPGGDIAGVACGDINRDGYDDAVITTDGHLCIYDGQSSDINTIDIESPGRPSLGDINSDGFPEIVFVGGDGYFKLYVYNHLGVLFDGFPVRLADDAAVGRIELLVADVDGDGSPDMIICLPDGGIVCYDHHGDMLGGFPLATSTKIKIPPLVNNLDGDADIEVAAMDSAGFISVWDLDILPDSVNLPWPMADGGYERRGYMAPEFVQAVVITPGFLPDGEVYNYPNPASDITYFRYYVDRSADVNIRIYDMSGELVDELISSTVGGVPDEVPWDCSEYASGVYFARLEADSPGFRKHVIIKVALIK